jgi:hypothetical protein
MLNDGQNVQTGKKSISSVEKKTPSVPVESVREFTAAARKLYAE